MEREIAVAAAIAVGLTPAALILSTGLIGRLLRRVLKLADEPI
jgi:hypothetical protein